MKGEKEAKRNAYELTRAEFLSPEEQQRLGHKEGLVAIEKIRNSPVRTELHYIGDSGAVKFMKNLEKSKK